MLMYLLYIVLSLIAIYLLYKLLIKPILSFCFTFYIECLPGRIDKINKKLKYEGDIISPEIKDRLEKKREKLVNSMFIWKY